MPTAGLPRNGFWQERQLVAHSHDGCYDDRREDSPGGKRRGGVRPCAMFFKTIFNPLFLWDFSCLPSDGWISPWGCSLVFAIISLQWNTSVMINWKAAKLKELFCVSWQRRFGLTLSCQAQAIKSYHLISHPPIFKLYWYCISISLFLRQVNAFFARCFPLVKVT